MHKASTAMTPDGCWSGVGANAREVFEDVVFSLTQVIGKVEVGLKSLSLLSFENMKRVFTG